MTTQVEVSFTVMLVRRSRLMDMSNAKINVAFQIFAKYGQVLKIVTFTKNSKYSFACKLYADLLSDYLTIGLKLYLLIQIYVFLWLLMTKCKRCILYAFFIWACLVEISGTFQALIQFADAVSAYNAKTVNNNITSLQCAK